MVRVLRLYPYSLVFVRMTKNLIIVIAFLMVSFSSYARTKAFPKKAFTGRWEYKQIHSNLVLVIKFEKGKNYATIVNVGTGEAPSFQLKAQMQGDKLIINPQTHENDLYIQMSVKNNRLIFKSQIAIWDENGNALPAKKNGYMTTIYRKLKYNK